MLFGCYIGPIQASQDGPGGLQPPWGALSSETGMVWFLRETVLFHDTGTTHTAYACRIHLKTSRYALMSRNVLRCEVLIVASRQRADSYVALCNRQASTAFTINPSIRVQMLSRPNHSGTLAKRTCLWKTKNRKHPLSTSMML